MEVVNPFILKNKERMIVFLDQLSSVQDPNPPPGSYIESSTSHLCSDAGKMLTLIIDHQIYDINRKLRIMSRITHSYYVAFLYGFNIICILEFFRS